MHLNAGASHLACWHSMCAFSHFFHYNVVVINYGCKMWGAESHCHLAAGCASHVLVGWPWTICFANEGSHPEHTSISGNCFFFYITTCRRMYFSLFPFCWFHCLLMDFEFISWFWSRTSIESTTVFGWGKLVGGRRQDTWPDTWSEKKKKNRTQDLFRFSQKP